MSGRQIIVRLPEDLRADATAAAKSRGLALSSYARMSIADAVKRDIRENRVTVDRLRILEAEADDD